MPKAVKKPEGTPSNKEKRQERKLTKPLMTQQQLLNYNTRRWLRFETQAEWANESAELKDGSSSYEYNHGNKSKGRLNAQRANRLRGRTIEHEENTQKFKDINSRVKRGHPFPVADSS